MKKINIAGFDIFSKEMLTFFAITLFYFFEYGQMTYFNVLAPAFLKENIYNHGQIAGLSAAYYYGDLIGLLPVGFFLDKFNMRNVLLWAITGSVISALLLASSQNYPIEWLARFFCGFFGGTFSFVGGIRIIAHLFQKKFTLFIGIFLSFGMLGGLLCQYPLLIAIEHVGIHGAMIAMAFFGFFIMLINFLYLHPVNIKKDYAEKEYCGTSWQMCLEILKNYKNWLDCFTVVLLDIPTTIIGSLWGIVLLVELYHFSSAKSATIIMSLFLGLIIGLPTFGILEDKFKHSRELVMFSSFISCASIFLMVFTKSLDPLFAGILFFILGFFTGSQSLIFTWLTQDMKPELIGRNTAANSMMLMGSGGGLKQLAAVFLSSGSMIAGKPPAVNLLFFAAFATLASGIYVFFRNKIFQII